MRTSNVEPEDSVQIERFGGFAGIGAPGSHVRSRALLKGSELSARERDSVTALFARGAGSVAPAPRPDAFRYHVTLFASGGRREIEVGEGELLESLQARVHDELI